MMITPNTLTRGGEGYPNGQRPPVAFALKNLYPVRDYFIEYYNKKWCARHARETMPLRPSLLSSP